MPQITFETTKSITIHELASGKSFIVEKEGKHSAPMSPSGLFDELRLSLGIVRRKRADKGATKPSAPKGK